MRQSHDYSMNRVILRIRRSLPCNQVVGVGIGSSRMGRATPCVQTWTNRCGTDAIC
jgi:hypothetical protein